MFSKIVSNNSNAMKGAQQKAFMNRQTKNQVKKSSGFVIYVNASNENRIRQIDVARLISPITPKVVLQ